MMVKDDSLYIIAIVAVVAVVGLVIMATGSTVVAEDLPSMVDSDDAAIAGQATRIGSGIMIDSGPFQEKDLELNTDGGPFQKGGTSKINTASDDAVGLAASLGDAEILTTYSKEGSDKDITAMPPEALAALSTEELAAMSSEELASLTSDQLSALSLDRLIAIIQAFQSQTQLNSFDVDHERRR